VIFGPTLAYSHVAYPYYILIFFILYYVCFAARRAPREMNLALVWALIVYCAIAYVTAGSISRYALPLLPVFAPCAAYTAVNCITHRRLKIYGSIYVCVAAIGLLVCYNLQMMTQQ
jgi:FtsH-binding integral membrane protein